VSKGRMEAFTDGVMAILITIMVLELKVPHGAELAALGALAPVVAAYVLSFIYLGIYWNNHHHLLHAATRVDGAILWANLHLLFWLSLIPFVTSWVGDHPRAPAPAALYGAVMLAAALAYTLLQWTIVRSQGPDSPLSAAIGRDRKGKASLALYAAAIPLAYLAPWLSYGLYAAVALIWLVPDPRIARRLAA